MNIKLIGILVCLFVIVFDFYSAAGHGTQNEKNICGKQIIKNKFKSNPVRGSFPWIATILKYDGEFVCSGTLVSMQEVVTAASCIQSKYKPRDLFIWLGGHDMKDFIRNNGTLSSVQSIHIHPSWRSLQRPSNNDIAVLVMKTEVEPNMYIQPICLTDHTPKISSQTEAFVIGYGSDDDLKQRHQLIPKLIRTSILSNNDCLEKNPYIRYELSDLTFCAGKESDIGICHADIGSGLFVSDEDTFYLRGVVPGISKQTLCKFNKFVAYVDVWKFKDWIAMIILKTKDLFKFVTVWAPNKFYREKDYQIIILPTNIKQGTEFSVNFRTSYGTIPLYSNKMQRVKLINRREIGARNEFQLKMILHRNESTSAGQRQMCIGQSLSINADKKHFYTFIQTDKPTYKPGDSVRFRVVVVDRDLRPYHMTSIKIKVIDPFNRPIKEFDDLENNFVGVFRGNFILSLNSPLGIWEMKVVVDFGNKFKTTKEFSVEKYTQPHFSAHMTLNNKHLLIDSVLHLSFYAKYSFGDFVRGNAEVRIKSINNGQIVATRSFKNIFDVQNILFSVRVDLKVTSLTIKQSYEAELLFSEPESGISGKKVLPFSVHADSSPKIQVIHAENFMPGIPFGIKVIVHDWKDELIKNSFERVKIMLECHKIRYITMISKDVSINNGIAFYTFDLAVDTYALDIKVYYLDIKYEQKIKKGSAIIEVNDLIIDHLPKRPNFGDNINITVKADEKFDQIIAVVMTRTGIKESRQIDCDFQTTCEFSIYVTKSMMPSAKVLVYYVKDKDNISYGETVISSEELGYNTLNISLTESAETRQEVSMAISTEPKSKVFLLGTEKFSGNEILKENAIKELSDFDGTNQVNVIETVQNKWHECTESELKMIFKGRYNIQHHGGDAFLGFDLGEYWDDDIIEESEENIPETSKGIIRDDFREVWLFEEFDVPDGSITKQFITPDSMTSWMISSFSMNDEYGLAIGSPKELVVKNQFFIQVLLPYSVRFKEPFRVDVLVHNYVDTSESLNVTVSISGSNDFIRFYENKCSKIPSVDKILTKSITVPENNVKRVSFYLHAGNDRQEILEHAELKIDTIAQAENGDIFNDKVTKKLNVEGSEIKKYIIEHEYHILKSTSSVINIPLSKNVSSDEKYPKFSVEITGAHLTDELKNAELEYEISASNSIDRTVEKLKENIEHLRYLKSKTSNPQKANNNYRSIFEKINLDFVSKNEQGHRAYLMEAFASAIEINAISLIENDIKIHLDVIKSHQKADGTFNNFGYYIRSTNEYFRTAYILIPFLKLKKHVTKNYDDVITKGFAYLSHIRYASVKDKEAYSVAALAYSLNNQNDKAYDLLNEVEKDVIRIDKVKKCFKLSRSQTKCDLRHTSYAAVAYLTLNRIDKAKTLISYIHNEFKNIKNISTKQNFGIATEALVKFLIAQPVYLSTNFTVTLTNELNFKEVVHITAENQNDSVDVYYPDYTADGKITIQGSGFSSITKITEISIEMRRIMSKFILIVNVPRSTSNTRTVQVCATYKPDNDYNSKNTLSVIYEVEMPRGYIYEEVVGMITNLNVKEAKARSRGSLVQIFYFDGFQRGKEYCVDITARKIFDSKCEKYALVTVYDFNDRESQAVDYYSFKNNC